MRAMLPEKAGDNSDRKKIAGLVKDTLRKKPFSAMSGVRTLRVSARAFRPD